MTTLKADLRPANAADLAFGPGPFANFATGAATAVEVNGVANERIECWVTGSSSIGMSRSLVTADAASACDTETYTVPIRVTNDDISLTLWRYLGGTDDAWVLFDDTTFPRANMFLVDCPAGFSGAAGVAAAGDTVDIYNVLIGSRSKSRSGDELQTFDATLSVIGAQFDIVLT